MKNSNSTKKNYLKILKNPWICIIAMILGIIVGHKWNNLGNWLSFPGQLYLSLLKMSVLPIIPAAIISGLAKMLKSGLGNKYLWKLVFIFILTALIGSIIGMLAAYIGQPGVELGQAGEAFIGQTLLFEQAKSTSQQGGLWAILKTMIPPNVFQAFSAGEVLGIIFISVMIGTAIGMSNSEGSEYLLNSISGVHEAFIKILSWALYGIPLGLFCLLAGQVAMLGIEAIFILSKFVIIFYLACFTHAVLYFIIIKFSTRYSFYQIFIAIRDPLFLAFSAASSIPPSPIAIENMETQLKQPKSVVNLVIPLGVAMNRHSYILLFSYSAVFISQLYGISISITQCCFIIFTSTIVGMATVGRSAAIAPLMNYVLAPIGAPVSVAIAVFSAIGPILDPIIQFNILFGSCANSALIAKTADNKDSTLKKTTTV